MMHGTYNVKLQSVSHIPILTSKEFLCYNGSPDNKILPHESYGGRFDILTVYIFRAVTVILPDEGPTVC